MANVESLMPITWSVYWKHLLSTALVVVVWTFVSGFFIALLGGLFQLSEQALGVIRMAVQLVVVLGASFFTLNYFLFASIGRTIRGKRLELVSEMPGERDNAH
ncbi:MULTISPECIES: hypothetical protein [unclassified Rhizobium]|uniref:hypothetical protein n=1 Tax=unclassified Rhizobium TaxID=2613769 RepID=UPI0018F671CA|nr:hypothetical protein [Rhizobium sp. BG4]QRM41998.1 hypothetical protein F2982_00295 [Rhizobium sp. BG4]